MNLASYNYLGFAENSGPCSEAAEQAVRRYGVAGCSPRNEYGERIIYIENKYGTFFSINFDGLAIVPLSKCFLCPLSDIFVRLSKRYMTTSKFLFFSHLRHNVSLWSERDTLET